MKSRRKRSAKRLNKSGLARFLRVSRTTITKYAGEPTAPKPDRQGRYDVAAFRTFITQEAPVLADRRNPAVAALKHEKLELEVAGLRREDALRRGEMVLVKDIMEWIEALPHTFDRALRKIFEERMPVACAGKTAPEIRVILSAALNAFADEVHAGNLQIEAKINSPKAHEKTESSAA